MSVKSGWTCPVGNWHCGNCLKCGQFECGSRPGQLAIRLKLPNCDWPSFTSIFSISNNWPAIDIIHLGGLRRNAMPLKRWPERLGPLWPGQCQFAAWQSFNCASCANLTAYAAHLSNAQGRLSRGGWMESNQTGAKWQEYLRGPGPARPGLACS